MLKYKCFLESQPNLKAGLSFTNPLKLWKRGIQTVYECGRQRSDIISHFTLAKAVQVKCRGCYMVMLTFL